MTDGATEWRDIPYGRWFPWLRLFRAAGDAAGSPQLLIAALGLILLHLGAGGLGRVSAPTDGPGATSLQAVRLRLPVNRGAVPPYLRELPGRVAEPVRWAIGPFLALFRVENDRPAFFRALIEAAWDLVVWTTVGGMLCRIALVKEARSERTGGLAAAHFALRNALTLVGSPLSPLLFVAFLTALCFVPLGLLYRIPGGASIASAVLLPLALLVGLLMTVILVGLSLAWPMMPPAVAAEEGDGFDALSRSFAYVSQRRGYYLFLVLLAWAVGIAGLVFADVIAFLVVHLTEWSLSFSGPREMLARLFGDRPGPVPTTAGSAHAFWLSAVSLLVRAWVFSYFWTAASKIYLLLRHSVDGTPFHELAATEGVRTPVRPSHEPGTEEPSAGGTSALAPHSPAAHPSSPGVPVIDG